MASIEVYYSTKDHTPYGAEISTASKHVRFRIEGSTAIVSEADCSGEFLQEAFDHVRELDFIQAVEEL